MKPNLTAIYRNLRYRTILAGDYGARNLFQNGEEGVWYDPSDLTTMFQDAAGTTAAVVGQPVGLMLDKSKGLVLGSELVTNGTFDSDTGWNTNAVWTISGGVASCAGGTNDLINTAITLTASKTYVLEFDCITYTSGTIGVSGLGTLITPVAGQRKRIHIYNKTQLYIQAFSFVGSLDNISVKELLGNHATQSTDLSRPVLRQSDDKYYLEFDGVDDFLVTSAIDFSATDKMSVFAGLRKLSDATQIIIELSTTVTTNAGSFYLVCGLNNTYHYTSMSRGSATAVAGQVAGLATPLQPDTAVLTATHNIAGDLSTIRRNGVAGVSGTADKGTGNFGNYVLYIGMRAGTTLPLNGHLYSLIVRDALSTSGEIADAERYVNSKTRAYND